MLGVCGVARLMACDDLTRAAFVGANGVDRQDQRKPPGQRG